MAEFVISASNVISPLCHSVLKLEPYTSCSFKCPYCYSRWYLGEAKFASEARPRWQVLRGFEALAAEVRRRGLAPIPFRLATLADPLPPCEAEHKLSLRLLEAARRLSYPLVVNTKSDMAAREPWLRALSSLAEEGLVLVQLSIPTFSDEAAKALEPGAPPPSVRLRAAEELSRAGVPVAVRLSPFIPGVSPGAEEAAEALSERGVKHVIVESLRLEPARLLELLRRLTGASLELEAYSIREAEGAAPVSRLSRSLLEPVYRAYAEALRKRGIGFATCKEGLFHLHTAEDCCGFYLLRGAARRMTLWDVYRRVASRGPVRAEEALGAAAEGVVRGEGLRPYPRGLSKPLRYHERRMLKVLSDGGVLSRVAPALALEGGLVVLREGAAKPPPP